MSARIPVVWRGNRVPGLYERVTSTGERRFDAYRKVNGQPRRMAIDATTVAEAVRKLPAALSQLDQQTTTVRSTFGDWSRDYLDALRERLARGELNGPYHIANVEARLRHLDALSAVPIADVTPEKADTLIEKLRAK